MDWQELLSPAYKSALGQALIVAYLVYKANKKRIAGFLKKVREDMKTYIAGEIDKALKEFTGHFDRMEKAVTGVKDEVKDLKQTFGSHGARLEAVERTVLDLSSGQEEIKVRVQRLESTKKE